MVTVRFEITPYPLTVTVSGDRPGAMQTLAKAVIQTAQPAGAWARMDDIAVQFVRDASLMSIATGTDAEATLVATVRDDKLHFIIGTGEEEMRPIPVNQFLMFVFSIV